MSHALYRKWGPQTWDAVVGQGQVVSTLRNALTAGRVSHAYLFSGPRGTGKTTTARLLAKAINCLDENVAARPCGQCEPCQSVAQGRFLDLIEIDAASNTSVEDVRDLRDKINFAPNQGSFKVYIIDEVHMLSTAAFNALLKTLEEPPPHAIFILATTEVHKIPATVLSRCQRHEFRRIPLQDIVNLLAEMARHENIQVEVDALKLIARQSTGAMRDAISLLDQLASTGQAITLEMAQSVLGTAASQTVIEVVGALVDKRADAGLDYIHAALDGGSDPRQLARQIVDYLRDLLLMRMGNATQVNATQEVMAVMGQHAQKLQPAELLQVLKIFNSAANDARNPWQPSLPLEMAFVEALNAADAAAPAAEMGRGRPEPAPTTGAQGAPRREDRPAARPTPQGRSDAEAGATAVPAHQEAAEPAKEDASAVDPLLNKRLADAWLQILNQVRQENNAAYGALNSATAKSLRGNTITISFASDVIRSKVDRPEVTTLLKKALLSVLGREIEVVFRVDTARRDSVPPGVDENGVVATAVRDLGGELVDIN